MKSEISGEELTEETLGSGREELMKSEIRL